MLSNIDNQCLKISFGNRDEGWECESWNQSEMWEWGHKSPDDNMFETKWMVMVETEENELAGKGSNYP